MLEQITGPLKSARVQPKDIKMPEMRDRSAYSASSLKDYLDTPYTHLGRKLLRTIPEEVIGTRTLTTFRLGSAWHSAVFEGPEVFVRDFPVYGGTSRTGTHWKQYAEKYAAEVKGNRVLTTAEATQVEGWAKNARKFLEAQKFFMEISGLRFEAAYPEMYFRCEFQNITLLAHIDYLMLFRTKDNRPVVIIVEGKTAAGDLTVDIKRGNAITSSHYDMAAVLYKHMVQSALRDVTNWGNVLAKETDTVNAADLVDFEPRFVFFWQSKETGQCVWDEIFKGPSGEEWQRAGELKILQAITNADRTHQLAQAWLTRVRRGRRDETLERKWQPGTESTTPAPGNLKYKIRDLEESLREVTPGQIALTPEKKIREFVDSNFPEFKSLPTPVFKEEKTKTPKLKEVPNADRNIEEIMDRAAMDVQESGYDGQQERLVYLAERPLDDTRTTSKGIVGVYLPNCFNGLLENPNFLNLSYVDGLKKKELQEDELLGVLGVHDGVDFTLNLKALRSKIKLYLINRFEIIRRLPDLRELQERDAKKLKEEKE